MPSKADMINRIAAEIRRPLLASNGTISAAIDSAIEIYQKDRFRISDIDPGVPETFNTVQGQSVYSISDNENIGTIFRIEYLNVFVGSTVEKMTVRTPKEIHLLNQQNQQSGQPTDYAYEGNKIVIYPIPSQVWQIFIGGHILVPAPTSDSDPSNPWMNWGEQLIRCHAKYEIATHITRNPTMAQAMSPDPAGGPNGQPGETWRAWRRLKNETNKIKSSRGVRAMRF